VLQAAVDALPPALRDRAPAAGRWSCAEVLEHLLRVERQVVKLLGRVVREAIAKGLGPETATTPVLSPDQEAWLLDRERRDTSPAPAAPRAAIDAAAAWTALCASRQELLALLAEADGRALSTLTAPHPLLGTIDVYQWFGFVGYHEARHAAQIRDLAKQLSASS
jgi:hypothetical protein